MIKIDTLKLRKKILTPSFCLVGVAAGMAAMSVVGQNVLAAEDASDEVSQASEKKANHQVRDVSDRGQYDYPELSVVPRASDRIKSEAIEERSHQWTTMLPFQVSGLSTLLAGLSGLSISNNGAYIAGTGIGGAWLVFSTLMAANYQPYHQAYKDLAKMPNGTLREQLTRERFAEEQLRHAAAVGEKIRWISIVSNLGASVGMLATSRQSAGPGSFPGSTSESGMALSRYGFAAVSAALSFAPLFFKPYWHTVYCEQMEYKKKIYSPVANANGAVFYDAGTRSYVPGVQFALSF